MSRSDCEEYLVRKILKESYTEEKGQFLTQLLESHKQGHLCLEAENAPEFPEADGALHPPFPVVKDQNRYYLQKNWVLETHILQELLRLQKTPPAPFFNAEVFEREIERVSLELLQKGAIQKAFRQTLAVLFGGPGTGKTYTASVFVELLAASAQKKPLRVVLTAPTGKAASHLRAALPLTPQVEIQSMTLHRLLKLAPGQNKLFSRTKIDADVVMVDEASMIDVPLLAHLLESVGSETRLCLIGDPDQLPPIEAGGLFKEMAPLFGTRLQISKRTDKKELQQLAETVNRGEWSESLPLLDWPFDEQIVQRLYEKIAPIFSASALDPETCLREMNQFRVLNPLRQGPFGIDFLNRQILYEMSLQARPHLYWVVPILITANRPERSLYNGTSGILIGKGALQLKNATAYFPEAVPFSKLPPFEVAFCLSIHKSQGSEFEKVLALFPPGSESFGKEALYTAITRARSQVELVGDDATLRAMLKTESAKRSGLLTRALNR